MYAPGFPGLTWQPSEYVPEVAGAPEEFGKIAGDAHGDIPVLAALDQVGGNLSNVNPAVALDASLPFNQWPAPIKEAAGSYKLVCASNVCHISPWEVSLGLIGGAQKALGPGGVLLIYGPFKIDGACTTPSNAEFDASLRQRNASWGYRDVADITSVAEKSGLTFQGMHEMPANNFMLHFIKAAL